MRPRLATAAEDARYDPVNGCGPDPTLSERVTVECNGDRSFGRRHFIGKLDGNELHHDTFDPYSAYHRGQFAIELYTRADNAAPDESYDLTWLGNKILEAGERPTTAGPALELFDVCDFIERHPTLREPVIEGIAREGETLNLIGDTKSWKSWLLENLGLTIATGGLWLGRFQCRRGKVLLIDNELPPEVLAFRIREIAASMCLVPDDYRGWLTVVSLRGNLCSFSELAIGLKDVPYGEYIAMLYDARYRFFTGDADENSNAHQAQFYNVADQLAHRTGAMQGFVHHGTKGNQADRKITDVGAGGGAQSRAVDAHLIMRQHETEGIYVLDGALRSFAPMQPTPLKWEFPLWAPEWSVDPAKLAGKLTGTDLRQQDRDRQGVDAILAALREGDATAREIRRRTALSKDRCDRLLAKLETDGHVVSATIKVRGNDCLKYHVVDE